MKSACYARQTSQKELREEDEPASFRRGDWGEVKLSCLLYELGSSGRLIPWNEWIKFYPPIVLCMQINESEGKSVGGEIINWTIPESSTWQEQEQGNYWLHFGTHGSEPHQQRERLGRDGRSGRTTFNQLPIKTGQAYSWTWFRQFVSE